MEPNLDIKAYLKDNGISQTFITRKANIDADKLSLSLNGKRRFTLDEYARICWVLKVNTDYFLKPRNPDERSEG